MEWTKNQHETKSLLFGKHEALWKKNLPPGVSLHVDWQGADTYSASLRKIGLQAAESPTNEEQALRRQAEAIVQRVTFLPENLALHELDKMQRKALLRSAVPFRKGSAVYFFEIQLTDGREVALYRVKNENHTTSLVPFVLSWDLAERLISTLAEILGES